MTDSARCNPKVVRRDYPSRIEAGLDTTEFFAKLHVVRNDDSSSYVPLKLGNPSLTPLSLHRPKVQFPHSDEGERNRLSLHVRAVQFSSGIAWFVQVREDVRIEEKSIHAEGGSSSTFVGCINKVVHIFINGPSADKITRVRDRANPLGCC